AWVPGRIGAPELMWLVWTPPTVRGAGSRPRSGASGHLSSPHFRQSDPQPYLVAMPDLTNSMPSLGPLRHLYMWCLQDNLARSGIHGIRCWRSEERRVGSV